MSNFYNVVPQFLDLNGDPYVSGKLYFGEENVDPKSNLQTIYLDELLTVPAANPQTLDSRGSPSQGTLYLQEAPLKYSVLLEDAAGNQIFNVPSAVGVDIPADLSAIPDVIIQGSLTVTSDVSTTVVIDSGVGAGSEGSLFWSEGGLPQWEWVRKAIVDGGNFILRRLAGSNAPDEPIHFPYTGGMVASWLGANRIVTHATGVTLVGDLDKQNQVLAAAGTFQHDGTPVGETVGITSAANTGTGAYTVTLDFFPVAEINLCAITNAETAGLPSITHGVGGANASGTVLVKTSNPDTGVAEDVTTFTVQVFDIGRT